MNRRTRAMLKTAKSAVISRSRRRSRGDSPACELPPETDVLPVKLATTAQPATLPSETPTSGDEIELLVVLQTGWAHLAEEILAKIFRIMLLEEKGRESTRCFACLSLACHQAVLAVAMRRWVPHGLKGLNARDAAGHTPLHHATKAGDANGVRGLLAAKSSVDAADPRGERPRIQRAEE